MTQFASKSKLAAAPSLALFLFAGTTNAAAPAQGLTETAPQALEAEAETAPAWRSFGSRGAACRFANRVRRCGVVVYRVSYDPYAGWWVVEYA